MELLTNTSPPANTSATTLAPRPIVLRPTFVRLERHSPSDGGSPPDNASVVRAD